jgi:hypothetical protein
MMYGLTADKLFFAYAQNDVVLSARNDVMFAINAAKPRIIRAANIMPKKKAVERLLFLWLRRWDW